MLGATIPLAVASAFARTGIAKSGNSVVQLHGWTFTQPKPLDHSTFADRETAAADFLEHRRWAQQLVRWQTVGRPELERACRALQAVDLASLDDAGLADHLDAGILVAVEGATWHFEQTALCALIGELLLSCREWGFDDAEVLPLLRGSSPASARTAGHLDAIADALRRADVRPTSLEDVRGASREAASALDDYLGEYGLRPVGSFDIGAKTLAEMPEVILASILTALDAPPSVQAEPDAALLRSRVPEGDGPRFDDLLASARAVYGLRDDDVSYLLWARGAIRVALLEAADRLISAGRLHERDDVVELIPSEVRALLLGSEGPTADDARGRREQRAAVALLDPPRSLGAVAATADLGSLPPTTRRLTAAYNAYFALRNTPPQLEPSTGVGIGHGAYRGRAVVARWADEAFAKLEPGDILVTTLTTPALNSVLAVCGALVVEEAGILSHAAVMARELDLVSVVGVLNATALIPDGADVEVDPVAGIVRVLGP